MNAHPNGRAPGRAQMDVAKVAAAVRTLLDALGEDLDREGLQRTPERVARYYAEALCGAGVDPACALDAIFHEPHSDLVIIRDLAFVSICEHHLLPFIGKAHVAYIPGDGGRIGGLSKFGRMVDLAARRLQVQERLTNQIGDAIESALSPKGAMVVLHAHHLCVSIRGVRDPGHLTTTWTARGVLRDKSSRKHEALSLLSAAPPQVADLIGVGRTGGSASTSVLP